MINELSEGDNLSPELFRDIKGLLSDADKAKQVGARWMQAAVLPAVSAVVLSTTRSTVIYVIQL